MRSSWELNYACYLDFLVKHGNIKSWEYEADVFWFEKIKSGVRSFRVDFTITNNDGSIEYHEVKGHLDKRSNTKLARMKRYYPKVKVVLIRAENYKAIKKISGMIPGWDKWLTTKPNGLSEDTERITRKNHTISQ